MEPRQFAIHVPQDPQRREIDRSRQGRWHHKVRLAIALAKGRSVST
jgi:hypothetical protein